MKDALGHGSDANGTHATKINAIPGKATSFNSGVSDATYHANMPIKNYTGQVQDMLGMWSGSQKPEPLSADETKQVNDAYEKRGDWREVAKSLHDARRGYSGDPQENTSRPGTRVRGYYKPGYNGAD